MSVSCFRLFRVTNERSLTLLPNSVSIIEADGLGSWSRRLNLPLCPISASQRLLGSFDVIIVFNFIAS